MKKLLIIILVFVSIQGYSQCPEITAENSFCQMTITIGPGGPGEYYYKVGDDFGNPGVSDVEYIGSAGTFTLNETWGWLCWWPEQTILVGYWDDNAPPDEMNGNVQITWCTSFEGPPCDVYYDAEVIIEETSECNVFNVSVEFESSGGNESCHGNSGGNYNFEYWVTSSVDYEWLNYNTIQFSNHPSGDIDFGISAEDFYNGVAAPPTSVTAPNCPCGEFSSVEIVPLSECGQIEIVYTVDDIEVINCFGEGFDVADLNSYDDLYVGVNTTEYLGNNIYQVFNSYYSNPYNPNNLSYSENAYYFLEYWDLDYPNVIDASLPMENCPCNDVPGLLEVLPQSECNTLLLELSGTPCQENSHYFNADFMVQGVFNDFDPSISGIDLLPGHNGGIHIDPWYYDADCEGCNIIDPNFDYSSDTYDITFQAINYLSPDNGNYEVLGEVTHTINRCPCGDPEASNYSGTESIYVYDCEFAECADADACDYNLSTPDPDNSLCLYPGCIDSEALNYDIDAGCDDGSCIYDPIPGDANGDFVIDILDLNLVSSNFGCPENCSGDANGDGAVNILDFLMVSTNWTN